MSMNPLPPQAYTKETMLKAYAWVMNQPPSIKELATTPDILVSLYLKAQRDGLDSLDRPSIQNFRDELKSLAGMMSTLSSSPQAAPSPNGSSSESAVITQDTPSAGKPIPPNPLNGVTVGTTSQALNSTAPPSAGAMFSHQGASSAASKFTLDGLDERSLSMIREVKRGLNLSNDMDSLRALIQLGYQALRDKISRD